MLRYCALALVFAVSALRGADLKYDLLLKGGHVVDPKNHVNGVRDVAIADGKVAVCAPNIPASLAYKTVQLAPEMFVIPGFVDIHTHVFSGSGLHGSQPIEQSVYPDSHSFRSGVTTMVDAGTSGWRNFPEFKSKIIDRSYTRVLAFLDIVGHGQAGGAFEQDPGDMDPQATAEMAKKYKDVVVGIKTAHYAGPEWVAVDRGLDAASQAGVPLMVDFGEFRKERPFPELILNKLRPGDIYTHLYLARVPLLDANGRVEPYMFQARERGVKFDLGHGQGSFIFRYAVPAVRQGFLPDSISTDLHTGSMNYGMKDILNVISKLLNMGVGMQDLILRATWNPAQEIHRADLGHLSAGAPADIAVLKIERGKFGFVDVFGARMDGTQRLSCELTVRAGKVVWDLNGITRQYWDKLGNYETQNDPRWDRTAEPRE